MIKYLFIIIFFSLINSSSANNKENIINNLIETTNINFDFEQNVNEKIEKGNCVIEYPKKIFFEYSVSNNKMICVFFPFSTFFGYSHPPEYYPQPRKSWLAESLVHVPPLVLDVDGGSSDQNLAASGEQKKRVGNTKY